MSHNQPFYFSAGSGHVPASQLRQDYAQPTTMQYQAAPQSAQQVPSQQPPQPPAMDMSVLEGISPEQLAAIARMFQSGALQMPPPVPTLSTQISTSIQTAPSVTERVSIASTSQSQPPPKVKEDEMDTEEGEVNESESDNTPATSRDFLHPPPTGPKNRSVSPRERKQRKASPRPPLTNAPASKQSQAQRSSGSQSIAVANGGRAVAKNEAAKAFVLEMVKAGYSYEDILPEVRNPKSLIRMFQELALPITSMHLADHSSQPNGTAAILSQVPVAAKSIASGDDTRRASIAKLQAPAKPTTKDRKAYLAELQAARSKKPETDPESKRNDYVARLQAARAKKAESVDTKSTKTEDLPLTEAKPAVTISDDVATQSQSADAKAEEGSTKQSLSSSKAAMNELVRQKLQALRAQQAAKKARNAASSFESTQPVTSTDSQTPTVPPQDGLGAGIAEISTRLAQTAAPPPLQTLQPDVQVPAGRESLTSPIPETPSRSFSNLPGLFMFGATSHPPAQSFQAADVTPRDILASSGQSKDSEAVPRSVPTQRKRAVASDFDDVSFRPNPVKRLFGQSRTASEDESLVIEVSEGEEEDDEMDPEPEPLPGAFAKTPLQTKSFRDVAPLRDFPPKHNFSAQTSSPGTPGGITYEQKMKEIEEFKRKIAEKEKRQKTNGKATVQSDITPSATDLGEQTASHPNKESDQTPDSGLTVKEIAHHPDALDKPELDDGISIERPESAIQSFKQLEKERLRQRLLELEHEEVEDDDDEDGEEEEIDEYTIGPAPEQTVSRAVPTTLISSPSNSQQQPLENSQSDRLGGEEAHASASEEGELTDDSMSNFYDVQDNERFEVQDEPPAHEPNGYSGITPPLSDTDVAPAPAPKDGLTGSSSALQPMTTATEGQFVDMYDGDGRTEPEINEVDVHPTSDDQYVAQPADEEIPAETESKSPADVHAEPSSTLVEGPTLDDSIHDSSFEDGELDENSEPPNDASAQAIETNLEQDQLISNAGSADTCDVLMADDDLAPELQPTQDGGSVFSNLESTYANHHFTPYRSPLQGFKDYRYHPEYLDTIAGGHRSTTYSYNIDPQTSFCPYETAGGECTDEACQFQHFKSLFVSDTELLKMMGTKHIPINTPDELKRWNEGLGHVVRELRNTNLGKDLNAIAARIATFRRDFVGDATKVLNLG